jgi:hypothetical protein
MSDIAQLISVIENIADQFSKTNALFADLQKELIASSVKVEEEKAKEKEEETAKKYIDFFSDELDNYISGGKLFVGRMNFIRQNYDKMTYHDLALLHKELVNKPAAGWAKRRQLLLTASAIWRYTFHGRCYKLRAQIEAVTECNDCGQFAKAMVDRMKSENIWK